MLPSYLEDHVSQIPALQLLINMGYQYLSPTQVDELRKGKRSAVILEGVLVEWLRTHNQIEYKGRTLAFTDANIRAAVDKLKAESPWGLVPANEEKYHLLTLGTSLPQTIDGDTRSYSLRYIDWHNPQNNIYHVTDEFSVERRGSRETRRPDLVCFVNGIPLVVIECKRPDIMMGSEKGVMEGVTQMLRNQNTEEGIPHLFHYSQLVLAISKNDALYATTDTLKKFWAVWQEEVDIDSELFPLINTPLDADTQERLYGERRHGGALRHYFDQLGNREITVQDRALYSLLHPERLLELVYQYLVFDNGVKKIARYQQYFAIKATLHRVGQLNHQGKRTGGIIWHTTGSGKSLTMVMLAKALALSLPNARVVLVTDRVNLDDQIYKTFKACGKQVAQAESGRHLMELLARSSAEIIATIIDKFDTVAREKVKNESPDIFVLVDESHRSQFGEIHAKMRQVLPNACYIGFTGTPLLKKEKEQLGRFGDFIHKYTMRQAVEDGAVMPLLYEGRLVDLQVDREQIDRWFERVTRDLTEEQKTDLKRKMSRAEEIGNVEQRLQEIAYDLSQHYQKNFQKGRWKAQLATTSKEVAIRYKEILDDIGIVNARVVISPPDTREGMESSDLRTAPPVQQFWRKQVLDVYHNEETYLRETLRSFASGDEDSIDLLIVVDMLLVGFDEPRNTVLYIDKPLQEHGLLQAIARVNRLFDGKEYGYVIDYRGVLGNLNEALETYNALEGYDTEDIAGTITDISQELDRLPQRHAELWAIFKTVPNTQDSEAMERFLEPEDIRQHFYEALNAYASSLKVALSSIQFYAEVPEKRIQGYKRDLNFFHHLRMAVKQRYAESIDYKEYETKIRDLLDKHLRADKATPITKLVNIFNQAEFDAEVERLLSPTAKADTIANRIKKTITEKVEEDPAFYEKFSQLIDDTLLAYREGRITELEYLNTMEETLAQIRTGQDRSYPPQVYQYKHAPAYYGILHEQLNVAPDRVADLAIELEGVIERLKIRDWLTNPEATRKIRLGINNCLEEWFEANNIPVQWDIVDTLVVDVLDVAKHRNYMA